jgi:hypothetical protein
MGNRFSNEIINPDLIKIKLSNQLLNFSQKMQI